MDITSNVVDHYEQGTPFDRIKAELARTHDLTALTADDLAGVDEFHLGGRAATVAMMTSIERHTEMRILDVGCGIGGVSRTIASETGAHVTGVDLTPVFVETAQQLSELVGLGDAVDFEVANATDLRFDDGEFDVVTLVHVGMNISDKRALFSELSRVLKPGGSVHVYDIMRVGDGAIEFPVPWSTHASTSFAETPDTYRDAMEAADLACTPPVNRLELVQSALSAAAENPPAVNLSHLMGEEWPTMITNLFACLRAGTLAPIEIIGHR